MTVRVGVVGAGVMGADHIRTLSGLVAGAEVTAVADLDAGRAGALAREVGARTCGSALELIGSDDVDAVLVASHDSTHPELVIAAVRLGKAVLCEKPLALTVAECEGIVAAEEERLGPAGPRLVSVGFSRRFDPATAALRESLGGGAIGRPLMAHALHRNVSGSPGGDTASAIRGSAIHELDQMPWLLGSPVVEVSWHAGASAAGPADSGLIDPQLILIRTADGVLTTVEVFVNARYGYDVRLELVGELGTLSLGEPALLVRNAGGHRSSAYAADWRPRFADAYRAELQAWIDSIRTGVPSERMATAVDGLRATAAAEAVIRSMNSGGAPVRLDAGPGGEGSAESRIPASHVSAPSSGGGS